ncbi:hypothetical protein D3C75_998590 [compost metagenome]
MPGRNALIDGDHKVWTNAVFQQRAIRRIDTNEQRPLGLLANGSQALEVQLQARPRGNHENIASSLRAKQLSYIAITLQQRLAGLQTLDAFR